MLSDFTTGFILKLVEQSVPTDAKTLKRNRYSKLIAALGEFKLLRPLIKRLKVRISNFNFESTLNIVSLCNNLYRARLLILALLKDITANGVFNLKREWSFLERRAENLNRSRLIPVSAAVTYEIEVERELIHKARTELIGIEFKVDNIKRSFYALTALISILQLTDLFLIRRGLIEPKLGNINITVSTAVTKLSELST